MSPKITDNIGKRFGQKFEKIINLALWFLIVIMMVSVLRNINKIVRIRKEVAKEQIKMAKMEADNRELARQIAETNDAIFMEKQIRNKLGMAKDGEAIVVLPEADILRRLAPKMELQEDFLPLPNRQKWLKLFAP